jgi:predicted DNA-binding transcriptional regulator AlpA
MRPGVNKRLLVSVEEAATMLGLSPKTLRNRLGPKAEREFPVKPVHIGRRVLFKVADLQEFVEAL